SANSVDLKILVFEIFDQLILALRRMSNAKFVSVLNHRYSFLHWFCWWFLNFVALTNSKHSLKNSSWPIERVNSMTLRLHVAFAAALGGPKLGKWKGLQTWPLRAGKVSRCCNLIFTRPVADFYLV